MLEREIYLSTRNFDLLGHVYTYATAKLKPIITSETGKALIQTCLAKDERSNPTTTTLNTHDVILTNENQELYSSTTDSAPCTSLPSFLWSLRFSYRHLDEVKCFLLLYITTFDMLFSVWNKILFRNLFIEPTFSFGRIHSPDWKQ